MKIKNILLVLFLLVGSISLNAQEKKGGGGFDVEKFRQEQADFLKKELNLTDTEMKAFIPLLNEFMAKKFEINHVARKESKVLRKNANRTEANYQKAIDAIAEAKIKEANLLKEYYKKFATVLPAEKVYKYHRAEMKFMRQALEKHKHDSKDHD